MYFCEMFINLISKLKNAILSTILNLFITNIPRQNKIFFNIIMQKNQTII